MLFSLPMDRRSGVVWVPTLLLSAKHVHVRKGLGEVEARVITTACP